MKNWTWSAALTIMVGGLQVDLAELPDHMREQIAACIREGHTEGVLFESDSIVRPA